MENSSNLVNAQRANLRSKRNIKTLDLCWDTESHVLPYYEKSELRLSLIPEACDHGFVGADDVYLSLLECLQPHSNVKKLQLRWCRSTIVPGRMGGPILPQADSRNMSTTMWQSSISSLRQSSHSQAPQHSGMFKYPSSAAGAAALPA